MFGKINFDAEVAAINSQMLAWKPADKIGFIMTLPTSPLLMVRVKRSQQREMDEFCEFEIMRRRGWLDIVTRAVREGQIPNHLAEEASARYVQLHPDESEAERDEAIGKGCFWGLALALPEKERVGEAPPVARHWAFEAFNLLEVPFDEEPLKTSFLNAARWTFVEARAGKLAG
jgi:hypothetical protein